MLHHTAMQKNCKKLIIIHMSETETPTLQDNASLYYGWYHVHAISLYVTNMRCSTNIVSMSKNRRHKLPSGTSAGKSQILCFQTSYSTPSLPHRKSKNGWGCSCCGCWGLVRLTKHGITKYFVSKAQNTHSECYLVIEQ